MRYGSAYFVRRVERLVVHGEEEEIRDWSVGRWVWSCSACLLVFAFVDGNVGRYRTWEEVHAWLPSCPSS